MSRLIKKADAVDEVRKLLQRVDEASDQLKDVYYVLFDNLNALFSSYPNLYKEIEMTVKLPSNDDAKDIVKFNNDLHAILQHLSDKDYLNTYINPQNSEQNTEQVDSPELPEENQENV